MYTPSSSMTMSSIVRVNCVRCHAPQAKAKLDLRGTRDANRVPASYRSLIAGGWVHYFDMTWSLRHNKAEPRSFGTLRGGVSRFQTVIDSTPFSPRQDR